jgi:lysophospholipase L1-like esterase
MHKIIDQEFPPENIIDLTSISGRDSLFYDHTHPTAAGADEYARLVSDKLAQVIAVNPEMGLFI